MSRRAAFLDRDGTINEKAPDGGYVTTPERFRFLDGAEQAVRMLACDGWLVVVVTNQRGVALGRMTLDDVDGVNERMAHLPISGVFVCPHERDSCGCRKPGTGLFEQARAAFPEIEFGRSVVIGDAESDMLAGRAIGARTFRVGPPPLPSLLEVVRNIVSGAAE
jgi:D-glycero-D-manno-heptose 1,7-bisphosphate phosphatase